MASLFENQLASILFSVLDNIEKRQDSDNPIIPSEELTKLKDECEKILLEGCEDTDEHIRRIVREVEEEKAANRSSITSPFRYIGLENHAEEDESKRPQVCRFAVERDGKVVFECWYDSTLQWILQPKQGGGFRYAKKRPLPSSVKSIRPYFKALAEKELEEPGAYAKANYIDEMPADIDF